MTSKEALDQCSGCGLFDRSVSDERKFQAIDKVMSMPSTKVSKVRFCYIAGWLLKRVKLQERQIGEMKRCAGRAFSESGG